MYALLKHPLFDCDLEEAALWYSRQNPTVTHRLIEEAERSIRAAVKNPLQFRSCYKIYRKVKLRGFPHSVYFGIDGETVYLLSLIHGSRDVEAILKTRISTM